MHSGQSNENRGMSRHAGHGFHQLLYPHAHHLLDTDIPCKSWMSILQHCRSYLHIHMASHHVVRNIQQVWSLQHFDGEVSSTSHALHYSSIQLYWLTRFPIC